MDFADAWNEADRLIENGLTDDEVEEMNAELRAARQSYETDRPGMFPFVENMDERMTQNFYDVIESFGFHAYYAGRIYQTDQEAGVVEVKMTPAELARYTSFLAARLAEAEGEE